jgi:peptidoglycan/xylan/chitin deacetylase (PgdA/CDA1 family)
VNAPGSLACAAIGVALAGCASTVSPAAPDHSSPPARFLLTFDDGPSHFTSYNPTRIILDTLADNRVQSGIKAVFFVQTRARNSGGGALGHALLERTRDEGHVLALHSGSPRGHLNHRRMAPADLAASLRDGISDLQALTGKPPSLVRPTLWDWDARTRAAYQADGLAMLLTDINARDGKVYGWNMSLRRRSHLHAGLARVRDRAAGAEMPLQGGVLPVVVTFHDTNTFTASHMEEYLQILLQESARVGLPVAAPPFYNDAREIEEVALMRARTGVYAAPP